MDDEVRAMSPPDLDTIDFSNPDDVRSRISRRHFEMFGVDDRGRVDEYLDLVADLFAGRFSGLQAMDTAYHDISHTLQATLCLVELLYNRHLTGDEPRIGPEEFRTALVAILFHDLGYLKTAEDTEGTGAKYTHIHEKRSCGYARKFLVERDWSPCQMRAIENMIKATGPLSDVTQIEFQDEVERVLGQSVCTADYIGQMSDPAYPDKLTVLFQEFEENFRYREMPFEEWPFKSYESLLRGTPGFWKVFVHRKMTVECDGIWRYLEHPVTGENVYLEAIAKNLEVIGRRISQLDDSGATSRRDVDQSLNAASASR